MRKGMPTGRMEEETRELLDYYNELYNWSYNDMVDYIIEHGEKKFIFEEKFISYANVEIYAENEEDARLQFQNGNYQYYDI